MGVVGAPVQDIQRLGPLDRSHLHLFLVGPGVGEAIALALPGRGWLFVDSCRTDDEAVSTLGVFRRFASGTDDRAECVVLTHPHEDHVSGLAELLTEVTPRCVAVSGAPEPRKSLIGAVKAVARTSPAGGTEGLICKEAVQAFKAIERWEEQHPDALLGLCAGEILPLESAGVVLTARAPDKDRMKQFYARDNWERRLRQAANELSLVLEIETQGARIVLGGDLPRFRPGTTTPVTTGWDLVMEQRPQLADHRAAKIPHHGSEAALHPALLSGPAREPRVWCVTPFDRSGLPRLGEGGPFHALLDLQPSIHLTRLPAPYIGGAPYTPVRFSDLAPRMKEEGDPFLAKGRDIRPREPSEGFDTLWCIAIDRDGAIDGLWRGRLGVELRA